MWRETLIFFLLACVNCRVVYGSLINADKVFVGWLGDTYSQQFAVKATSKDGLQSEQAQDKIQVLSWDPRVFLHRDFLTPEEAEHMVAAAAPRLQPSIVTAPDTAEPVLDTRRTSSGMFFNRREDAIIDAVEQRIAKWVMLPAHNSEGIQVLQYQPGQKYDLHTDYFDFPSHILKGGNRVATVILYLTDVEEGGETVFPHVPRLAQQTAGSGWTPCGMQGLAVRPRKGEALLFWSQRPDGLFDPLTQHASCPVVRGTKVVATRWIHEQEYEVTADKEGPLHPQHHQEQLQAAAGLIGVQ